MNTLWEVVIVFARSPHFLVLLLPNNICIRRFWHDDVETLSSIQQNFVDVILLTFYKNILLKSDNSFVDCCEMDLSLIIMLFEQCHSVVVIQDIYSANFAASIVIQ